MRKQGFFRFSHCRAELSVSHCLDKCHCFVACFKRVTTILHKSDNADAVWLNFVTAACPYVPLLSRIKSRSFSPFERRPLVFEPHLLHVLSLHHFQEVFFHFVCDQRQVTHSGQQQLQRKQGNSGIKTSLTI